MCRTHTFNSRIDHFRDVVGIDLPAVFPASPRNPEKVATWTNNAFLSAARKLHAAGFGKLERPNHLENACTKDDAENGSAAIKK